MNLPKKVESSLYEVLYSEWGAVHYDKEELQRFLDKYHTLKNTNTHPEELEKLEKVIELRKLDHLVRLASGDEEASKWAFREKLARTGAADLLLTNVFSRETLKEITQIPSEDIPLVLKRIREVMGAVRKMTVQEDALDNSIPGA